jgi:hypothetical protein
MTILVYVYSNNSIQVPNMRQLSIVLTIEVFRFIVMKGKQWEAVRVTL